MADGPDWGAAAAGAGAGATIGSAIVPGVGTVVGGLIGFAAPIIGDLIGRALASGDKEKARQLMDQAVAQFGPDILKAPEVAAVTPHLGPSAMAGVTADPNAVSAQQAALSQLQRYSEEGPNNLEYRAQTDAAQRDANQQANAQSGALANEMQARGLGGSGVEMATRALAQQGAAERASSGGMQAAVGARQHALQALQGYGSMAGQIRSQSFGEGAQRATATDEVNRFNELGRTAGAQQAFNNQMGLSTARANAYGQAANGYNGQAAQTQQQWGNYGQAAGTAGATLGNAYDEYQQYKRSQRGGG